MQTNNFEAYFAGILIFKTVLQSAPEYAIFVQKIEKKFSPGPSPTGEGHPSLAHPFGPTKL